MFKFDLYISTKYDRLIDLRQEGRRSVKFTESEKTGQDQQKYNATGKSSRDDTIIDSV